MNGERWCSRSVPKITDIHIHINMQYHEANAANAIDTIYHTYIVYYTSYIIHRIPCFIYHTLYMIHRISYIVYHTYIYIYCTYYINIYIYITGMAIGIVVTTLIFTSISCCHMCITKTYMSTITILMLFCLSRLDCAQPPRTAWGTPFVYSCKRRPRGKQIVFHTAVAATCP